MPSLELYKKILCSPKTDGQARKMQSDDIILATWNEDIASRVAYIYDYYHDDEPLLYKGMHPENSTTKVPVDVKYLEKAYNSESKDQVGYDIMFKPRYDWHNDKRLAYYQKDFEDKYEAMFPIGLFIDLYDDNANIWRKWLITENSNWLATQFPTWYILPCDHLFQWIDNGNMYQMCGVSRSQSSYNKITVA